MEQPDVQAFQDFIDILSNPSERKSYFENRDMVRGRPSEAIPAHLRDVLADLSTREISLIADVNKKLCEEDLANMKDILCIV
jgi:hypothetical protein